MKGKLHHLRQHYTQAALLEEEASHDPIEQFGIWFEEALKGGVTEPNAMTLATAGTDGKPRTRTVLLKDYGARGFSYFTNLESIKADQSRQQPWVSVLFPWIQMERQVRIDGFITLLGRDEVEAYFKTRPRESQLGAWASYQSRPVESRHALEQRLAEITARFDGQEIPPPPFWGGYLLQPTCFEFWQGRPARLHDRLEYSRSEDGIWHIRRLQP